MACSHIWFWHGICWSHSAADDRILKQIQDIREKKELYSVFCDPVGTYIDTLPADNYCFSVNGLIKMKIIHWKKQNRWCASACMLLKAKPLLYLLIAFLYDIVLYWYIYTRLQDGTERAGVLGSCSSTLTTLLMTVPAFELVSSLINMFFVVMDYSFKTLWI